MTITNIRGWAAHGAKQPLELYTYDAGPLAPEEVEIAVEYCGLCHSDLAIINNEWGLSQYPVVLGHEAVGRVVAVGEQVKGLQVGQWVGVGWNAESDMHCQQCVTGNHNLCT
jgi:alcohol/geraniol dehydrogenase (NADP+)